MVKNSILLGAVVFALSTTAHADLSISNKSTRNLNCASGVCKATAKNAVLNLGELVDMLTAGDVTVKTGAGAANIVVEEPFGWLTAARLTLIAAKTIEVDAQLTVGGKGSVTLKNGGTPGNDLVFGRRGRLDFYDRSSHLVINGADYRLVDNIKGLAAGVAAKPSGNFALSSNHNAHNESYDDSPVPVFHGTFEGLGHTIRHLTINNKDANGNVGLFGEMTGIVRNIALKHVAIEAGGAAFVGGVAGISTGLVVRATVNGKIRGNAYYAGGLVGDNGSGSGQILQSSAKVIVDGQVAGGLVGNNDGAIAQSFAAGRLTGPGGGLVGFQSQGNVSDSYVRTRASEGIGGLIGEGNVAVTSVYSAGKVGQVPNSGGFAGAVWTNAAQNAYWNTNTSGQTTGCGSGDCSNIAGLTDVQLKSGLPDGFDPQIWGSDANINNGYPYLLANPPQ